MQNSGIQNDCRGVPWCALMARVPSGRSAQRAKRLLRNTGRGWKVEGGLMIEFGELAGVREL